MQFWRDRRFLGSLAVGLCLIAAMFFTANPERAPTPVERLWREMIAPSEGILANLSQRLEGALGNVLRFHTILQENERLRQEVDRLRGMEVQMERLTRENEHLRAMLQLEREVEFETIQASVVARSPSDWTHQVTLDKGETDGVRVGDVVVVSAGLVGRVIRTSVNTSLAMLITSPESGLGIETVSAGDAGVASGQLAQRGKLLVTFFDPGVEVHKGEILITSGFGDVFPHGIPVGEVVQVSTDELGLLREVWVEPSSKLNRLREVIILSVDEHGSVDWPAPIGR